MVLTAALETPLNMGLFSEVSFALTYPTLPYVFVSLLSVSPTTLEVLGKQILLFTTISYSAQHIISSQ